MSELNRLGKINIIDKKDLAKLIYEDITKIQVIDVRDEDFIGGNIKGALNFPSKQFDESTYETINSRVEPNTKLIFHCALSQVRGPMCAKRFLGYKAASDPKNLEIYVLQGGFNSFQRSYKQDTRLVENFIQEYHEDY